jgi:hypothetical protein
LEICDVILRLLAVSVVHSFLLERWICPDLVINAPTLAYLVEQCQSLKILSLKDLEMHENHIRVLGAFSRLDLKIELIRCTITSAGASTLVEVLGRNQGPTKLINCFPIDNLALANSLRGNRRLKSWSFRLSTSDEVRNREFLAIAGALRENQGLVDLDLCNHFGMSDETLGAVCDSLKTHPTLEVLNLRGAITIPMDTTAPAALKSQIQKLMDMMKVNASIHTIYLDNRLYQHELFEESVIPYLETNRFRPRLLAIQRTHPIAYRAKILGRALLSARTDVNSFWMLLSGNAEIAFPSTTTTIATASNLPTPSNATAPSTTNVAAAALTTTVIGNLPSATAATITVISAVTLSNVAASANVATPSAGQKRKARP